MKSHFTFCGNAALLFLPRWLSNSGGAREEQKGLATRRAKKRLLVT